MEVLLLGTGAADGWPNPWCTCRSCAWARRDPARARTHTSALLDGTLLLDCGPDVPRQADRAGVGLAGVQAVLLTHGHWDHADPAAVLTRAWAGRRPPLAVHGPASALARLTEWRAPHATDGSDGLTLVPLGPDDEVEVVGYRVRALGAAHTAGSAPEKVGAEAVLYDITAPDGARLLYATDTGPLPAATLDAVSGRAYDLVLLDETFGTITDHGTGHLDLATFPHALAELRRRGALTPATEVIAVHLGHHNPPGPELERILAAWGARAVPDLASVQVRTGPDPVPAAAARHHRPQRELVLGGARSGKSHYAEQRLAAVPDVTYVATSGARPDDREWAARIARHRARRPASWHTAETSDLAPVLAQAPAGSAVLVDCLTLWLTAVLDETQAWDGPDGNDVVERRIAELVAALATTAAQVVLVSNEVGSGVVPAYASGRLFQDRLGELNTRIAAVCDEVTLVVAGRPVRLGG